jgi:hypothetical protein
MNVVANDSYDGSVIVSVHVFPANGILDPPGDGTSWEYTPNPSFTGEDSFICEICDTGGLCDTATVTITVQQP